MQPKTADQKKTISMQYWQALIDKAGDRYPQLACKAPSYGNYQYAEIFKSGDPLYIRSHASFAERARLLKVEIYIGGNRAKQAFHELHSHKNEIEKYFGNPLRWEEMPNHKGSHIAFHMKGDQDRFDLGAWDMQHEWILTHWPRLSDAVRSFAKKLS